MELRHIHGVPLASTRRHQQLQQIDISYPFFFNIFLSPFFSHTFSGDTQMPISKSDLISTVAQTAGLTKADAGKAVDAVLSTISDTLKRGDAVNLIGFGTFSVKARAARTGLNPRTKAPIAIPASNTPAFKAGKALKDAVN